MADLITFSEAENYLNSFIFSTSKPPQYYRTLDRTITLLKTLGDPQQKYPIIHITGTSGKGSTSHITAAILQEAGYKVGLFTSPSLQTVTERFLINRRLMPNSEFIKYVNILKPIIDDMVMRDPNNSITYFEIITCLAYLYFADEKVDYVVMEVGMGGRFDSTNVCESKVAIVTNIGLDHTQVLGDTIELIAQEKMGIIKPNSIGVTGATQPSVLNLIREHSRLVNVPLFELNKDIQVSNYQFENGKAKFDYSFHNFILKDLSINLLGQYQSENAALAITAIKVLKDPKVTNISIRSALQKITIPGRIEIISKFNKNLILDGAHNPMKINALVKAMQSQYPRVKFPIFFCVKQDKDMAAMIKSLLPICSKFYITTFSKITDLGANVMAETTEIKTAIHEIDNHVSVETLDLNIVTKVIKEIREESILFTGSLYFVGAIRDILHLPWNSNN